MSDRSKRRRYDDEFRASAVLMLEAAGYPEQKERALGQVSRNLKVPRSTLQGWFSGQNNPPPPKVRQETKLNLVQAIREELAGIFETMPNKRGEAHYRELAVAVGILVDKLQLLTGQPTWRGQIVDLLRSGAITPDDIIEAELGDELATELFDAAGVARATS